MKKLQKGDHVLTVQQTTPVNKIGLTAKNCTAVHTQDTPYKSYVPGRGINSLKTLEEGKSYLFKLKSPVTIKADLSNGEV